jgi:hypothetical protein
MRQNEVSAQLKRSFGAAKNVGGENGFVRVSSEQLFYSLEIRVKMASLPTLCSRLG